MLSRYRERTHAEVDHLDYGLLDVCFLREQEVLRLDVPVANLRRGSSGTLDEHKSPHNGPLQELRDFGATTAESGP